MPRYKLTIEYDGGTFFGWQRQPGAASVQGMIEAAAAKIDGAPVDVFGSGRTDAGVHALGQVAHLDLVKDLRADKLRDALNFHLGDDPISVLDVQSAAPEFNARFDASSREYLYRIIDRRPKLALEIGRVWRLPVALDVEAMHAAAQSLIGFHDFTTFRDTQCQAASPEKTLDVLSVSRAGGEIYVTAKARSFLHKQVRSMVGSLVDVGRGYWPPQQIKKALAAKDRTACGQVAPPEGLYLVKVNYDSETIDPKARG